MKELAKPSTNVCATKKYLKEKLQLKYKQNVYLFIYFFSEINSKLDVVCFRNMANFIVNDSWYKPRNKIA